jgi:hypothetical protein
LKDVDDNDVQAAKPGVTGSALTWTDVPAGTYHVVATANGGCNSTTEETTVSENALPNAPSAEDVSRCGPGSVELTALVVTAEHLYGMMADGNAVHTGSPFNTDVDATTSFFVSCSNGGCGK